MRTRLLIVLWVVVAVAVWNGFFDLYVSRGAREYLQLSAEFRLGQGPEPAMVEVMTRARHDGIVGATLWAVAVLAAGWGTVAVAGSMTSSSPRA